MPTQQDMPSTITALLAQLDANQQHLRRLTAHNHAQTMALSQLQQSDRHHQEEFRQIMAEISGMVGIVAEHSRQEAALISNTRGRAEAVKKNQAVTDGCNWRAVHNKSIEFSYVVGNPSPCESLAQRVQNYEEEEQAKGKRREQEIRSYKIRISLAEIEYKEVINRLKKQ